MSGDCMAFVIICICAVIIALFMAWYLATYEPIKPTWLIKKELEEKDRKKMGVFINSGNGYQPIKRADKLDIEIKPPETRSNVEPAPAKSVNVTIDSADADFDFFHNLSHLGMEKARSLLQAIPPEIKSGDRLIIRCPNCDHKVYVQRNGDEVRMNCGGCQLDVVAHITTVKTLKIGKICDTTRISKSHILGGR